MVFLTITSTELGRARQTFVLFAKTFYKTKDQHTLVNNNHMINTVCDKSVTHNKPFHIILSIPRGYQVTIVYCDVSRYCIQYKKSGTFKLIPQSSYISAQYTRIDLKHSQNLQSSMQFHHIFYYLSIYMASTYI